MNTTTTQPRLQPVNFLASQKVPKNGPYLLEYSRPTSSEEAIGQIPSNGRTNLTETGTSEIHYTDTFKPNDAIELSGWNRVYFDQPHFKDGKPLFRKERELVQLGPKSGVTEGFLGGAAGTILGAAAGAALVGLGVLAAPVGLALAAAVGTGAAIMAAADARKDVRELQWVETPIVSRELNGFRQSVSRHQTDDEHGVSEVYYRASYEPLTKDTRHGTWMKPVVVNKRV